MKTSNTICPNCGTEGMDTFYQVGGLPVHSCLMFDEQEEALNYPTRDLSLGFCQACGFISNVIFDTTVQEYSAGYEEQQSFSPRFRKFQTELCTRLIERYGLTGKDVVEIGCGKGDFLVELCELGGNRGVGIDPTCDPKRMEDRGAGRVEFLQEFYSAKQADLPCDFLVCRHTLEHISPTADFVGNIREVIGKRKELLVFFELPDVERVLVESAFWDIYYEHCSYFSLGSLARLFRAHRFDVVELVKDYDDQYLVIVAKPVDEPTTANLDQEDDLDLLKAQVERFRTEVVSKVNEWKTRLEELKRQGKRVVIWGSGSKCVSFLSAVVTGGMIDAVVDVNPYRQNRYLAGSGQEVVAPASLGQSPVDVILVMNPIYCDEIQRDLDEMGVRAELVPV